MRTKQPIFAAIASGDDEALTSLLATNSSLVHTRDETEARRPTTLHAAAFFGNLAATRLLLAAGADGNELDAEETTPLGVAAFYGHVEVVAELLAQGVNPTTRNKFGFTPLAVAMAGAQGSWRSHSPAPPEAWRSIVTALRQRGAQP